MLKPEQTCLYKNIDFVAYGEGERTLSALIKKLKRMIKNIAMCLG